MILIRFALPILGLCAMFPALTFGQRVPSRLEATRVTIKAEYSPLGTVFGKLMFEYGINIGLEESTLDRDHFDYNFATNILTQTNKTSVGSTKGFARCCQVFHATAHLISLDLHDRSLSEALDKIVEQMSNYRWEINGDVVNIIPSKGRDDVYKQFLELKIAKYSLNKGTKIEDIKASFADLPEVKRFLTDHKIKYSYSRVILGDLDTPLKDECKFQNIRMLDLLNRIAKIKPGGWILRERVSQRSMDKYLDLDI